MTDELKQALKDLNDAAYNARKAAEHVAEPVTKQRLATIARWTDEMVEAI